MYLSLIVFVAAALLVGAVVTRVAKVAIDRLFANNRNERSENPSPKEDKKKETEKTLSKEESKDKTESQSQVEDVNVFSEEQKARIEEAKGSGIGEAFWKEKTDFSIDGKTIADTCVKTSPLTYLEVNNRELARSDFMGFNLIIEQDSRMVLTYNGQAVATLTKIEKTTEKVTNGNTESVKTVFYRTNTFPPKLSEGMVPSDVEKMLDAVNAIRTAEGNPYFVSDEMISRFTSPENVEKFKRNIAPKVQAKESRMLSKTEKDAHNLRPSHRL